MRDIIADSGKRDPTFTVRFDPTMPTVNTGDRFQVTLSNRPNQVSFLNPQPLVSQGGGGIDVRMEVKAKIQKRCVHWPNCNQGEACQYVHPSQLCKLFPNCPNPADKCLYIHPATSGPTAAANAAPSTTPSTTLCKFGAYCKNPECPYRHVTPKASDIPCRFYPNCTNPTCPFKHDPTAAVVAAATATDGDASMASSQATTMSTAKPNAANPPLKVPVPCRDGAGCTRPGCYYMHPWDANTSLDQVVPCKYGVYCSRPDCPYNHPSRNKQLVLNKPDGDGHVSERSFAVDGASEHLPMAGNGLMAPHQNNHETHVIVEGQDDVSMD